MSSLIFGVISPHPPIFVRAVGGSRAEVTRASLDALALAAGALSAFDPRDGRHHVAACPDAVRCIRRGRLRSLRGLARAVR